MMMMMRSKNKAEFIPCWFERQTTHTRPFLGDIFERGFLVKFLVIVTCPSMLYNHNPSHATTNHRLVCFSVTLSFLFLAELHNIGHVPLII